MKRAKDKFPFLSEDYTYETNSLNDEAYADPDAGNSNDGMIEWSENSRKPLLFRGGFFRFLKREGVTVRAECLNCRSGNVYSGHTRSNSNLLKHLSVSDLLLLLWTKKRDKRLCFFNLANAPESLRSLFGNERGGKKDVASGKARISSTTNSKI